MSNTISRVFISLLITIVALLFTHAWWYPVGVVVSLQCQVEKDTNFQVFYLTEKDEKWGKNRTKQKLVSKKDTSVSFFLPCQKLHRLRIDTGEKPGRVTINKVDVIGESKTVSLNLRGIKHFNYDSIEKNNVISAVSNHRDPFIVFIDTLDVLGMRDEILWFKVLSLVFIVAVGSCLALSYFNHRKSLIKNELSPPPPLPSRTHTRIVILHWTFCELWGYV